MAVTAISAVPAVGYTLDVFIGEASASNTINVGDYLVFAGNGVRSTALGAATPSGAGIALESSPVYDQWGNSVNNTALRFMIQGRMRVSASFSGQPALGLSVYPVATGSGVAGVTGLTGVASTWNTAAPVANSANENSSGVGRLLKWYNSGPAGTGQMDILITPPAPGYY